MRQRDKNTDGFMEWFIDPKAAASKSVLMGVVSLIGTIVLIVLIMW